MKDEFVFKEYGYGLLLVEYLGDAETVVIPDTYNGEPVTQIGCEAFQNNKTLKEVTIPKSVRILEFFAFLHCNISKINIQNKNIKIHDHILYEEEIEQLEHLSIGAWKLMNPIYLPDVVANKVNNWETLSSEDKKLILTFIRRKNTLKKALFTSGKLPLVSFLIENKITINLDDINLYLQHSIEEDYPEITAVFLEYKEKNYYKHEVEQYQENLELVEIGLELPTLAQLKKKWNVGMVKGGVRITGYKGTETVETIPKELACGTKIVSVSHANNKYYEPIEHLKIEADITTIEKNTFNHCQSLTSIKLPESTVTIEYQAFYKCVNLIEIEMPYGLVEIKESAFKFSGIEKIVLPNSVRIIGESTFSCCEKLKEVVLSNSLKRIPRDCFGYCKILKEITIPRSVVFINNTAFHECTILELVKIEGENEKIYDAFTYCYHAKFVKI